MLFGSRFGMRIVSIGGGDYKTRASCVRAGGVAYTLPQQGCRFSGVQHRMQSVHCGFSGTNFVALNIALVGAEIRQDRVADCTTAGGDACNI